MARFYPIFYQPKREVRRVINSGPHPPHSLHNPSRRPFVYEPFSIFGMSTRSYHGCWTCKRRRRRCDNTQPSCQNCAERGVDCEGYEVRLRWGSGIVSRGRFTGADKPLDENVPARPKGRRRDLSRKRMSLEAQRGREVLEFVLAWS